MNSAEILAKLKAKGSRKNREGMARFGINVNNAFGVSVPNMRAIAKSAGRNMDTARELWKTGLHEARIVASMIGEPDKIGDKEMDSWVEGFNSWDLCDQVIMNLFEKTPLAERKIREWAGRDEEFVKRAGYVMMARLAVSDKRAPDRFFTKFFPLIKKGAYDKRNYVKKAVNWAIRQIGKRNMELNARAVELCKKLLETGSEPGVWIANDALRELTSNEVAGRLNEKRRKGRTC